MALVKRTFCLDNILQGGELCGNPTITWEAPSCIAVECITNNNKCIEVEILEDCPDSCITVTIDCDDCENCPPITQQICFCVDSDSCTGPCEYCDNGVCKSFCPDGKVCDNETCVDCILDSECECDQVCIQGTCQCPAGLIERVDGCCVECIDNTNCGPCEICVNGDCVPKDCPDGFCHPVTGICQECVNNEHCTDPNTCCIGGQCVCCPGYFQDPLTGLCVPIPNCFESTDCPVCFDCVNGICVPKVCPDGQTCDPNTGNCVPECENGDCPDGSGCINGICVPCDELSCTPAGLQCQFALGCECVDGDCVPIDCDLTDVSLQWVVTPGVPGTVTNPGQPALQGTWNITPGAVITPPPIYMNHNFSFTITNATSGTWTVHSGNSPIITLTGNTNTNSFNLNGVTPLFLYGFIVEFTEAGTGRTASFGVWATPSLALDDPNRFNNSNVDFSSNGIPPSTTGGTPGTLKLCPNNGNFSLVSATGAALSGDIMVSFFANGAGCLTAIVTGCGLWDGTAIAECGGVQVEIPIPELFRDPANCCDFTDPNCPGGFGEPCTTPTILTATLIKNPTGGIVVNPPNTGDGEFSIVWDWVADGFDFFQVDALSISAGCWSFGENTAIAGNPNDLNFNLGPLGVSGNHWAVNVTMGEGGCVFFGETCEIRVPGCRQLKGTVCLDKCNDFDVIIAADLSPANTYTAWPTLEGAVITYSWRYPTTGVVVGIGKTVTITPVGGPTTLTVFATYGSSGLCLGDDSLTFNTQIAGCTNTLACNFTLGATEDNGTCITISNPVYTCPSGFLGVSPTATSPDGQALIAGIQYYVDDNLTSLGAGLTPGPHTVEVWINGQLGCTRNLTVPTCWSCNVDSNCINSPGNIGGAPSEAECLATCGCTIVLTVVPSASGCVDGRQAFDMYVSGGLGGPYTVAVEDSSLNQIWNNSGVPVPSRVYGPPFIPSVTTPGFCDDNYQFIASEGALNQDCTSVSRAPTCGCETSDFSIVSVAPTAQGDPFCSNGVLNVTYNTYPCAPSHTLLVYPGTCVSHSFVDVGQVTTNTSGLQQTVAIVMAVPADGAYALQLGEALSGCTDCVDIVINCGGTLTCDIGTVNINSQSNNGTTVSIGGTAALGTIGTNNYRAELYQIPGACTTPITGGNLIATVLLNGTGGTVPWSFSAIAHDNSTTCFGVRIVKLDNLACRVDRSTTIPVTVTPTCVPGNITFTPPYNEDGQFLPVTISPAFQNTTGGVNVYVQVSNVLACNTGTDDYVHANGTIQNLPTRFLTGWLLGGTFNVPIPQLPGSPRCITVTVVNAADDSGLPGSVFSTTAPVGCYDQDSTTLAGCTCSISITAVEYSEIAEELQVEYTSSCTTPPTDLLVIFEEFTDINYNVSAGVLGSTTVSAESGIIFSAGITGPITPGAVDRFILITIEDSTDAACMASQDFTLEGCPVCASQTLAVGFRTGQSQVIDVDTNVIVTYNSIFGSENVAGNNGFRNALQAALNALDECSIAVVNWAFVPGIGGSGDCLGIVHNYTVVGTPTQTHRFTGVDINTPNVYVASINYATFTLGIGAAIAGADQLIADFIAAALDSEGIPYDGVSVDVLAAGNDTVTLEINISGIDTGTHTVDLLTEDPIGTPDNNPLTIGCVDASDSDVFTESESGRVVFTVTNSSIVLDTLTNVNAPTRNWDTTAC